MARSMRRSVEYGVASGLLQTPSTTASGPGTARRAVRKAPSRSHTVGSPPCSAALP